MGLLARTRWRIRGPGGYVLYAVAIASVVAPLTRAFAPMATNTALALLGVLLVAGAMGPRPRRAWAAALARARALADTAPVGARGRGPPFPRRSTGCERWRRRSS